MPNDQWDDFALTREFAALDRRIETYEDAVKGLAHFPIDVATAALNIEHLTDEVGRVRLAVTDVRQECEHIRQDWQTQADSRKKGRTAIVVAVITGCFTVLAALVVLAGAVLGA